MNRRSVAIGVVISVAAVFVAVRRVDVHATAAALRAAHPGLLLVALVLLAASVGVRCWRWQHLFQPASEVRFHSAVAATSIGYLVNSVLPGRLGEPVRALVIAETEHVSFGYALGTIVIERLLDVATLLVFLGVAALREPPPPWVARGASVLAVLAVSGALAFVALARARRRIAAWLYAHIHPGHTPLGGGRYGRSVLSRFAEAVVAALAAADMLSPPRRAIARLGESLLLWGSAATAAYLAMRAFSLPVPVAAPVLVVAVTNLGMVVPSGPAYVGVYHLLATETLVVFGVDRSAALAYAVAMHALIFGLFIVGGLGFLWRQPYVFANLWRRAIGARAGEAQSPGQPPAPRAVLNESYRGRRRTAIW